MQIVDIADVKLGPDQPLMVIAGPCAMESLDTCRSIGESLRDQCSRLGLGYIFKASFDKANRSSIHSRRGPGMENGLRQLENIKTDLGVPVTTDIHEPDHAQSAAEVVDLLQIPAFLCRQTDLLVAAAATGKPVNVKKGQFLSPREMQSVVQKLEESCPQNTASGGIILTERGTFFGYNRLVNDFAGLGDLMKMGWPICFDVTHSTQRPGEGDDPEMIVSGGQPERAPLLARCAIAAGVHALFIETHPKPAAALSDAATMLPLQETLLLLEELALLRNALISCRT